MKMKLLLFIMLLASCVSLKLSSQPIKKTALEIMSDSVIWGKNLPLVIAQVEALANEGQKSVELFPAVILSSERYAANQGDLIQKKIANFQKALAETDTSMLYKKFPKAFSFAKPAGNVTKYELDETDSVAVAVTFNTNNNFFNPETKMATIFKRLGKPQSIGTEVIHGPGEERPQILTLYNYADGVIVFAEAEMAPEPGLLNRVILDIPRLVNDLKTQMK